MAIAARRKPRFMRFFGEFRRLRLISAISLRPRPDTPEERPLADDYDVTCEGETVGRIYWANAGTPTGQAWFWSIIFHFRRPGANADQGYAASRAAAMAAFRGPWDAMG
jgi:hypothetical protein